MLDTEAGPLFVEIAVTHFVDEVKLTKLTASGNLTLEIDLSGYERDQTGLALAQAVVHNTGDNRFKKSQLQERVNFNESGQNTK